MKLLSFIRACLRRKPQRHVVPRVIHRGAVWLHQRTFMHHMLVTMEGMTVSVVYSLDDDSTVRIETPKGLFICDAVKVEQVQFDSSLIHDARAARLKGQVERMNRKLELQSSESDSHPSARLRKIHAWEAKAVELYLGPKSLSISQIAFTLRDLHGFADATESAVRRFIKSLPSKVEATTSRHALAAAMSAQPHIPQRMTVGDEIHDVCVLDVWINGDRPRLHVVMDRWTRKVTSYELSTGSDAGTTPAAPLFPPGKPQDMFACGPVELFFRKLRDVVERRGRIYNSEARLAHDIARFVASYNAVR